MHVCKKKWHVSWQSGQRIGRVGWNMKKRRAYFNWGKLLQGVENKIIQGTENKMTRGLTIQMTRLIIKKHWGVGTDSKNDKGSQNTSD